MTAHATPRPPASQKRRPKPGAPARLVGSPHARLPSAVVRGPLADGLMVCLGLLARDPDRFEPAAVAWHGRWCARVPGIGFAEAHAALSALEALAGSDPAAAGDALRAACRSHGLDGVATVLDALPERRPRPAAARPALGPPGDTTAA